MNIQPKSSLPINWTNSITQNLVVAVNSAANQYFTPELSKSTKTFETLTSPISNSGINPSQTNFRVPFAYNPPLGLTTFSIGYVNGTENSGSAQFGIRLRADDNVNSVQFGIGVESFSANLNAFWLISYSDFTSQSGTFAHGQGNSNSKLGLALTYQHNTTNGIKAYVNGVNVNSANTDTRTPINTSNTVAFINDSEGGTKNTGYPTYCNYLWTRSLSAIEIQSLYQDPWQVFLPVPVPRRIWVPIEQEPSVNAYFQGKSSSVYY